MIYHGFEVFFLFLGNADSILIRHYNQGTKTVLLVDGGRKAHTPVVRKFLSDMGESVIDHLICSHHHDDHAGGLVDLVADTTLTYRKAWVHSGDLAVDRIDRARYQRFASLLRVVEASKKTQNDLLAALARRGIRPEEPFAVKQAGPVSIVSPTEAFFNAQLELIHQEAIVTALGERYQKREARALLERRGQVQAEEAEDDGELGGETTSPENEISTILMLPWKTDNQTKYFLLTADAGTAALTDLKVRSDQSNSILRNLSWMQIPHHGSRRNMDDGLIDYYKPQTSFVSAKGSKKHPSVKLVNAVKARNGKVYSTHYPPEKAEGIWIRQTEGDVPALTTSPAKALWD